jgi:hypothetical protein
VVAGAVLWVVAVRLAACVTTGAGLAAVAWLVRLTARVDLVVLVAGAVALVSAAGAVSVVAGCSVVAGVSWLVAGCVWGAASCAVAWVEESARAAAIAGKARIRA